MKEDLIKKLIKLANTLDNNNLLEEADIVTKIAQAIKNIKK